MIYMEIVIKVKTEAKAKRIVWRDQTLRERKLMWRTLTKQKCLKTPQFQLPELSPRQARKLRNRVSQETPEKLGLGLGEAVRLSRRVFL
jgi:hypothetical protein